MPAFMHLEVDQSGKIERTDVNTVIAYANNRDARSIVISAHDKRTLQTMFRDAGKPHLFVYRTFAILLFLLLRDQLGKVQGVTIDDEYPGWHFMIKNFLLQEIRKILPEFDRTQVHVRCIGKHSPAHRKAYETAIGRQPPDLVATYRDIARFVIK